MPRQQAVQGAHAVQLLGLARRRDGHHARTERDGDTLENVREIRLFLEIGEGFVSLLGGCFIVRRRS